MTKTSIATPHESPLHADWRPVEGLVPAEAYNRAVEHYRRDWLQYEQLHAAVCNGRNWLAMVDVVMEIGRPDQIGKACRLTIRKIARLRLHLKNARRVLIEYDDQLNEIRETARAALPPGTPGTIVDLVHIMGERLEHFDLARADSARFEAISEKQKVIIQNLRAAVKKRDAEIEQLRAQVPAEVG